MPRLTAVLLALLLLLAALPVLARPPQNIGLVSFEATVLPAAIRLEWEVATEVGTAGYKIKRGENGSFAFLRGSGGGDLVIVAEGGPAIGYVYSHTDEEVTAGATYVYQLVELTTASDEVVQDEITVVMDFQPTSTPIVLPTTAPGGGGQSATLTPTPTVPATATRPPTSVPPTAVPNAPPAAATPLPAASSTAAAPTAAPAAGSGNSNNNAPAPTSAPPAAGVADAYPAPDVSVAAQDGDVLPPSGVEVAAAAAELPLEGSGYPGPESAPAADGSVAAAPLQSGDPASSGDAGPVVISGGANTALPTAVALGPGPAAAQETGQEGGLLFLWLAFLAALTIFVAAVIGAIILYTRRKSG